MADLRLPEVRCGDASFGEAEIPGLDRRLAIRGVLGDSHAALFGECGFEAGAAKATYGTGSSIMVHVGSEPVDPPEGIVLSLAWGLQDGIDYALEGNIHSTGDTLRWLRDRVGLFSDFQEMEQAAAGLADNRGVYLVPAFAGLGAPYWAPEARAIITGMDRGAGRDHILRAALESIAYQVRDLIGQMARDPRVRISGLRVDGGATANRFLMQFQADVLGMPVLVADIADVSARGAAFVAGLACGLWPDRQALRPLAAERRSYAPEMPLEQRERLLEGWRSAVRQALAGADPRTR